MPVVKVEMWKGRTKKQKKLLAKKVTEAVVNSVNCSPEAVHVIISDVDKDNWAIGGVLASEMKK